LGNDFFKQEETDESELPLSRDKVFLLEQNLKTLILKLNSAQSNSGKGLNFIFELGILQQARVCSEQLLMMGVGIKQGELQQQNNTDAYQQFLSQNYHLKIQKQDKLVDKSSINILNFLKEVKLMSTAKSKNLHSKF
jgi:hypothetical protein